MNPPFYGIKFLENIALDKVLPYLNKKSLFKAQWGIKKYRELWDFCEKKLNEILSSFSFAFFLSAVYGYFIAQRKGNKLFIFDENLKEIEKFEFKAQKHKKIDFVCLMAVTSGKKVSEEEEKIFNSGEYEKYLYLHGLGAEITEAIAEYVHEIVKKEIRIEGSLKRYSFGYPVLPSIEDQWKILNILQAEKIEISLTETLMLFPEQSITAIIVP